MKKVFIILLVILIAAFMAYKYVYQSHRDIKSEHPEFTVKALDLAGEFSKDQEASSLKYLNKTLIVQGKLTEIEENSLMLDEVIFFTFTENFDRSDFNLGSGVQIKGRCIGYDDLLEVVKIDQSIVLE